MMASTPPIISSWPRPHRPARTTACTCGIDSHARPSICSKTASFSFASGCRGSTASAHRKHFSAARARPINIRRLAATYWARVYWAGEALGNSQQVVQRLVETIVLGRCLTRDQQCRRTPGALVQDVPGKALGFRVLFSDQRVGGSPKQSLPRLGQQDGQETDCGGGQEEDGGDPSLSESEPSRGIPRVQQQSHSIHRRQPTATSVR